MALYCVEILGIQTVLDEKIGNAGWVTWKWRQLCPSKQIRCRLISDAELRYPADKLMNYSGGLVHEFLKFT